MVYINNLFIRPCPFCKEGVHLEVRTIDVEDREGYPTAIHCESCGCYGPWFYTKNKDEASVDLIHLWNRAHNHTQ